MLGPSPVRVGVTAAVFGGRWSGRDRLIPWVRRGGVSANSGRMRERAHRAQGYFQVREITR